MIGSNTKKRITQVSDKTSFTLHQYRMVGVSHGNVSVMDYTGVALDRLYCTYVRDGRGVTWKRITQVSDYKGVG